MNKVDKEFKPSVWAIGKSNIIYFLMFIFLALGINAYNELPREDFPEIVTSEVFISTINPGNTAEDIERFITVPLEEAVKGVSNLVDIKSTSLENYSIISLEFDEEINIELAKQKVRDEIDSVISGEDWPTFNNVKVEPDILSMSLAEEMPILNVNIQGDYPTEQLKKYAEVIEDRIEKLDEIKEVDILGAQDEEIEVGASGDPRVYHSTMILIVDGYVQTFSNLDDHLYQIGIEVQVAMAGDIDINNLVKGSYLSSVDISYSGEGTSPIGIIRHNYSLLYRIRFMKNLNQKVLKCKLLLFYIFLIKFYKVMKINIKIEN